MEAASDAEEPASEEAKDVPVEPTVVDLSTVTVEDLPLLMKVLEFGPQWNTCIVVHHLQTMAKEDPELLADAVKPFITSHKWKLRRAAWRILGATGLAWASFLRAVEHVDSGVRRDAIVGLRFWMVPAEHEQEVCKIIAGLLEDSESEVRMAAMDVMQDMIPGDEEARAALFQMLLLRLEDTDSDIRVQALNLLSLYFQHGFMEISAAIEVGKCPQCEPRVCAHVLGQLAVLGCDAARGYVYKLQANADAEVRMAAYDALGAVNKGSKDTNAFLRKRYQGELAGPKESRLEVIACRFKSWALQEDMEPTEAAAQCFRHFPASGRRSLLRSLTPKTSEVSLGSFPADFCSEAEIKVARHLAQCLAEPSQPMYELADFGDPWDYWSVHASSDRTKVSIVQNSRFGIGDVTFLMVMYGKLEYVQDTVKRLTKHTVHTTGGLKLEESRSFTAGAFLRGSTDKSETFRRSGVTVILKSLGLLGDWAVDRLHKMTQMVGMYCDGDWRRPLLIDAIGGCLDCSGQDQIAAMPEKPRDVVGDIRVCRYLRFYSGDVAKASAAFAKYLQYWVDEKIHVLREGLMDLELKDFTKWLESVMSPYTPHFVPGFTTTQDGSFKPNEFVSKRPACHTLENDLALIRVSLEYFMKQVDDNCYKRRRMCYAIKLIPVLVWLTVNLTWVVRTRKAEDVPFLKPLLYQDESRVKKWMERSSAGISHSGADPKPPPSANVSETADASASRTEQASGYERAEQPETLEPLPVVNLEDVGPPEDVQPESDMKVDIQEATATSGGWLCSCSAPC
eukprot:g27434.t1